MILRDEGPQTSLDEDLKTLGISHLFETEAAAAPRTEVPVRTENEDEDEDDEEGDEGDEGDEEEGEETDEEYEERLNAFINEWADENDIADDALEAACKDEEFVAEAADRMAAADAKYEAALNVLEAFYSHLAEGENEGIDRDALIGVIEAYECVVNMEEAIKPYKLDPMGHRVAKSTEEKRAQRLGGRRLAKTSRKTSTKRKSKKSKRRSRGARQIIRGGEKVRRTRGQIKKKRLGEMGTSVEQNGDTLSELIQNLSDLKQTVVEGKDARDVSSGLIEGFAAIRDTAGTWMEAIANEVNSVKHEDEFDAENDARVAMGRHLDEISGDANKIIEAIESGDADLDEAAEDLQALAADLDDAANAMKQID